MSEESDQFRFLRDYYLVNLKGSVGLMLKSSAMRVTIPIDLSTRSFIPLPRFFHSRRVPSLLTPSLVLFPHVVHFVGLTGFNVHHRSNVTFFPLTLAFFYSDVINSPRENINIVDLSRILYHFLVSSILTVPHLFLPLSSYFSLHTLPNRNMLVWC